MSGIQTEFKSRERRISDDLKQTIISCRLKTDTIPKCNLKTQGGHSRLEGNLSQPFMFTYSENNHGINDYFYNKAEDIIYAITIANTAHSNYADLSLVGGFQKLTGQLGKIDGNQCIRIIREYVLAFFDKHLKGKDATLLDSPSFDYPEVEFKFRSP